MEMALDPVLALAMAAAPCPSVDHSALPQVETYFSSLTDYWIGLRRTSSAKPYVFTNGGAVCVRGTPSSCSWWQQRWHLTGECCPQATR
jgi:hypothetical protein